MVMRSQWGAIGLGCDLGGGADAGVQSVLGGSVTLSSLSLSLCASETRKWFVEKIEI